eukprot:TRINITY_DN3210_c0_g1_i1.p1 TRINITY_DN3210_c0_g1~~TRINITY_DN3210_c0_g1_i1.p1  ORF type:complete len:270 (+),score=64.82 TRINITY_DN3210_c0_g1_i1:71-880(+)
MGNAESQGGKLPNSSSHASTIPHSVNPSNEPSNQFSSIGIVTVTAASKTSRVDPEIEELNSITRFEPIIRNSVNPFAVPVFNYGGMNAAVMLQQLRSFQNFFKTSAQNSASKQNLLSNKVRQLELYTSKIYHRLVNQNEEIEKHVQQTSQLEKINSSLVNVKVLLTNVMAKMEQLNSLLPPEKRLEPLRSALKKRLDQKKEKDSNEASQSLSVQINLSELTIKEIPTEEDGGDKKEVKEERMEDNAGSTNVQDNKEIKSETKENDEQNV